MNIFLDTALTRRAFSEPDAVGISGLEEAEDCFGNALASTWKIA